MAEKKIENQVEKTTGDLANLLKASESNNHEIVKLFKDYVRKKGWMLGYEVAKALELYLTRRNTLDKLEKEAPFK